MIQQKHKESFLLTKRCFTFAFVFASLLTFGTFGFIYYQQVYLSDGQI